MANVLLRTLWAGKLCQLYMSQVSVRNGRGDFIYVIINVRGDDVLTFVEQLRAMLIAIRGGVVRAFRIDRHLFAMLLIYLTRFIGASIRAWLARADCIYTRLGQLFAPAHCINDRAFDKGRMEVAPLSGGALCNVHVVTQPGLNRVFRHFVIAASAAAKARRRQRVQVFLFSPFRRVVGATCVLGMWVKLLVFRVQEMSVHCQTITVPLRVNSAQVFHRRVICRAVCVVLSFQVDRVRGRLVSGMVLIAVQRVGRPILVFLVRLTFQVCRFQFSPRARLGTSIHHFLRRLSSAIERLNGNFFPISRSLVIATTKVLVNGPTVIGRRRVGSWYGDFVRGVSRLIFVGIGVNHFPIIRRYRAKFLAILRLVFTYPALRVTTNFPLAFHTMDRGRLQYTRRFVQFRQMLQYVQISAKGCTRTVFVVRFGHGAMVSYPSSDSRWCVSNVLFHFPIRDGRGG